MIGCLSLFQFLILFLHLASQRADFLLHFPVFHLYTIHLSADLFAFFLMSLNDLLLL